MGFCISFGMFDFKLFFYCFLFFILEIFNYFFFKSNNDNTTIDNEDNKNLLQNHKIMLLFCFYLGYLLNIIPELITRKKSDQNDKFLSIKDIINSILVCLMMINIFYLDFWQCI